MKIAKMLAIIAGAAGLFAASPALADPVVWNLSNVTFADGGSATGSFTFDASTNVVSAFAIAVTGGDTNTFPAATYDNTDASAYVFDPSTFLFGLNDSVRQIRFVTDAGLTNAGGTVNLTSSGLAAECYNCSPYRLYASGTLSSAAVPEPTTWAMMLLGFGAIGIATRRKRTAALVRA